MQHEVPLSAGLGAQPGQPGAGIPALPRLGTQDSQQGIIVLGRWPTATLLFSQKLQPPP